MTGTEETDETPDSHTMIEALLASAANYLADVKQTIDASPANDQRLPAMLSLKANYAVAATTWARAMLELDEDDDAGDDAGDVIEVIHNRAPVDAAELELLDKRVADLEHYITEAGELIDVRGELEQTKRELEGTHRRAAELAAQLEASRDLTQYGQVRIVELEEIVAKQTTELDERGFRIDALEQAAAAAGVDVDVVGTDDEQRCNSLSSTGVQCERYPLGHTGMHTAPGIEWLGGTPTPAPATSKPQRRKAGAK